MKQTRVGAGRSWPRGVSALLLAVFGLQGCYSVSAVEPGGPQPGSRVVASLTTEGSQQLASQVGPRVVAVEGVLDEATATQLSVRLVRTESLNQGSTYWNQEELAIPRPAIAQLRQRRLDRPRSYLAAAVIIGGAFVAALAGRSVFAGDEAPGTNPPPAN